MEVERRKNSSLFLPAVKGLISVLIGLDHCNTAMTNCYLLVGALQDVPEKPHKV